MNHGSADGGIIRIANGCVVKRGRVAEVRLPGSLLAKLQVLEYLRVFLSGRMGWAALRSTLIISGAFGIFRRQTVVDAGGQATDTVGEDMELVVRLHRRCGDSGIPYAIHFVPDPVAWTECPESIRVPARQRNRWQRGPLRTLIRHRAVLLRPRYGRIGMLALPYFFLAVEELSFQRYPRLSDLLTLFGLAVPENIGFRQLSTWWRFLGTVSAFREGQAWGKMTRRAFASERAEDLA